MTQEPLDEVVRQRIRSLRLARGWTLDTLAARCSLSASTLSRIETGHRRIALDQLVPIAAALGTTLDQLVEPDDDEDVVIRPEPEAQAGSTIWLLSRERDRRGVTIAKMRITPEREMSAPGVHPGYEWFTVLSGTIRLRLGERNILVREGQAAEFPTMTPHAILAHDGPAEILTIFDHDGERAHMPGHRRASHDRQTPTNTGPPSGADDTD
ncbi:XRE family transcriptional regulator [Frondihabitans sp. PAMC 28766]|uniref:helix-turn-helix domain-containing protein n=1 Tax=Frondihabitans sp. PAMC 28766 TaxID=1795630 RepID=UPI00078E6FE5|nr:XRE family transcriptional regulator [Frondihabitans sp. PAMC 28766]AMM19761.1 XRE family transcriptional regulator [Frondihabitans sp. PAMC 28766]